MLNQTGIKKSSYISTNQILFNTDPFVAVSIIVDDTLGVTDPATGRKLVKAGTPLAGDLTKRETAFAAVNNASDSLASDAKGILLHDVDVTTGKANGTLLIFGFVNVDRIDTTVMKKNNEYVKEALKGIYFLK
nr:MAG TPA: Head decoration protein [Caudoviricetes sp.]